MNNKTELQGGGEKQLGILSDEYKKNPCAKSHLGKLNQGKPNMTESTLADQNAICRK